MTPSYRVRSVTFGRGPGLRRGRRRRDACGSTAYGPGSGARGPGPINAKAPGGMDSGGLGFVGLPGGDLLSRGLHRTIIGAAPFHGPVRDGKAWVRRAMATRQFGGRGGMLPGQGSDPASRCSGMKCVGVVMGDRGGSHKCWCLRVTRALCVLRLAKRLRL